MNQTELQLSMITEDISKLGHRLNNISSQLSATMEANNSALEDLCGRMVRDHLKLAEVMDAFVRYALDDGSATDAEKEELIGILNAFLNRNQNNG